MKNNVVDRHSSSARVLLDAASNKRWESSARCKTQTSEPIYCLCAMLPDCIKLLTEDWGYGSHWAIEVCRLHADRRRWCWLSLEQKYILKRYLLKKTMNINVSTFQSLIIFHKWTSPHFWLP
jgi:hypothetical protein